MEQSEIWNNIESIVGRFVEMQRVELRDRWGAWKIDLTHREKFEVIGGLLTRQITLVEEFALAPTTWNLNVAPLVLRAMIDNYINLAWIFVDPVDRSRKFVLYGLGEEKLQIEHSKQRLRSFNIDPDKNEVIQNRLTWLDNQRFSFLTEVTIGSWSGISARKMAEEADCLDLYNNDYQSHSSAAHSMWNFVGKFNLITCSNPLHGFHRVPLIYSQPDIYLLLEASDLARRALDLFDTKTDVRVDSPKAHSHLVKSLNKFGLTMKRMRERKQ